MVIKSAAVGTESAIKIRSVEQAFTDMGIAVAPVRKNVASGVPAQPFGKRTMQLGASNRASHARTLVPGLDIYIGIESGLHQEDDQWFDTACVVILKGTSDVQYAAFSAFFPVPGWIVNRVLQNATEIGHVVQSLAGGGEKDVMKWFSKNTVLREDLLSQAIKFALVPILFSDRYGQP